MKPDKSLHIFATSILFLFFLFINTDAKAQLYNRSYTLPGFAIKSNCSRMLADGNLLIAGTKSPSTQDQSLFVLKINTATGDTIWSAAFTNNLHFITGIAADELTDGHIIVAANIIDSAGAPVQRNTLLISLEATGTLAWSKKYTFPGNASFRSPQVRRLPGNKFLVCNTNEDSTGISLVKMNNLGDTLFSKAIRIDSSITPGDYLVTDILPLADGYYFSGLLDYSGENANFLLFKTDTTGHVLWLKSDYGYPATGPLSGLYTVTTNLLQTPDSNIVVGMNAAITAILKTDQNGNALWFKMINDTDSYNTYPQYGNIALANDGGLLITGETDVNNIAGTYNHVGKQMIMKLDAAANLVWSKKYKFEKNNNDCNFISQLPSGAIICSGTIYDTIIASSVGRSRMYAMRLDSNGVSSGSACSLDEIYTPFEFVRPLTLYNRTYHQFGGNDFNAVSLSSAHAPIIVNEVPILLSASISSTQNAYCQGELITVIANYSNGGTAPTFTFKVNGTVVQTGSASLYQSSSLTYPDTIVCIVTSNAPCVVPDTIASNVILPLIWPTYTPSVTISATPTGLLLPGTAVTFIATITNAGPSPYILWQKNGVTVFASSDTFTTASLSNGDIIQCKVVSSSSFCATNPTGYSNMMFIAMADGVPAMPVKGRFSIYPNPASKQIIITNPFGTDATVFIKDILGRNISEGKISQSMQHLDVSSLQPGLYIAEIFSEEGKETMQLVIE